mgnify:CR=1 FL=1
MQITNSFTLTLPLAHSEIACTVVKDLDKIKLLDSVVAEVRDTVKEEEIWGWGTACHSATTESSSFLLSKTLRIAYISKALRYIQHDTHLL